MSCATRGKLFRKFYESMNPEKENILESRICKTCQSSFAIYEKDREMLEKLSPSFGETRYELPLPIDCPLCRRQKRFAWRNTARIYKRKCDFTGNSMIAFYDETVDHPVYDIDIWHSDKWDPLKYGREFDFSRPFFDQFHELKKKVPHYSRSILNFENSDYCNNASDLKNCYLSFGG